MAARARPLLRWLGHPVQRHGSTPSPALNAFLTCWQKRWASRKAPLPRPYGDEREASEAGAASKDFRILELHDPDAPPETRELAAGSWSKIIPSRMDPATRLALLRKMRELDWPAHLHNWASDSAEDEDRLYRWLDEALGQAFYQKGLWRPPDWTDADAEDEEAYRQEMRAVLAGEMEGQMQQSFRERFGDAVVEAALKEEPDYAKLPALVWESASSGELEWMAEHTADVVLPYLVGLTSDRHMEAPRRFWERQARSWAGRMGGTAAGLGGAEPLPFSEEDEESPQPTSQNPADPLDRL